MHRIGIDLGGTKIEGIVLGDDGADPAFGERPVELDDRGIPIAPGGRQVADPRSLGSGEREDEVVEPLVGGIARGLHVSAATIVQRHHRRSCPAEIGADRGDIAQRVVIRYQPFVGRDQHHIVPAELMIGQNAKRRQGGCASGQRQHGPSAGLNGAFDDVGDRVRRPMCQLGFVAESQPLDVVHR